MVSELQAEVDELAEALEVVTAVYGVDRGPKFERVMTAATKHLNHLRRLIDIDREDMERRLNKGWVHVEPGLYTNKS